MANSSQDDCTLLCSQDHAILSLDDAAADTGRVLPEAHRQLRIRLEKSSRVTCARLNLLGAHTYHGIRISTQGLSLVGRPAVDQVFERPFRHKSMQRVGEYG